MPRRFAEELSNQHAIGLRRGVYVYAGWRAQVYGELGSRGLSVAGLNVYCSNGGGTADGNLAYAWVIFTARAHRLSVVGILTPRTKPLPHELPTTIWIAIKRGRIISREFWYGPRDGTCCPSGRATTSWSYSHGRLHPQPTVVTRRPDGVS